MRRLIAAAGILVVLAAPASAAGIAVSAGESFRGALTELAARYEREQGEKIDLSFAASSQLAKSAEAGGVEIVACAKSWGDTLEKEGLFAPGSRRDLLGDHLVLIAPAANPATITLAPHAPLAGLLNGGRLAMGDPAKVQTGRYAQSALVTLGLWDMLMPTLLLTDNVRAALAAVSHGEAALGVVYQTDLQDHTDVRVAGTFADDTHPPIAYTFALTKTASPAAHKFLAYMESPQAMAAYRKAGFVALDGQ